MQDKRARLEEVLDLLRPGTHLALVGGGLRTAPMGFLRSALRKGVRGLRLTTVTGGGLDADLLVGAGAVETLETCYVTLGPYGVAPNFRRAVQEGRLRVLDNT